MAQRGFKVDYGIQPGDKLAPKIHDTEIRGDQVGQYQVGPDGLIHWVAVANIVAGKPLYPGDPSIFLYKRVYRAF